MRFFRIDFGLAHDVIYFSKERGGKEFLSLAISLSSYQTTLQTFSTESWVEFGNVTRGFQMKTTERKVFSSKSDDNFTPAIWTFFCRKLSWCQAIIVIGECTEKKGRQKFIRRRRWFQVLTKPNLSNQTDQNKYTKPNFPNQTHQTKPTKPNLPNQTYQTKPK